METFDPSLIQSISFISEYLIYFMCGVFLIGVFLRVLIYFNIRSESNFIKHFEKQVFIHVIDEAQALKQDLNFHSITERLLETTYRQVYDLKKTNLRRRFDYISSLTDRVFLLKEAAARLIRDILKHTQYSKKNTRPKQFSDIAKFVTSHNPIYNKLWGVIPVNLSNDIILLLPGLFIVGGIFGTFLGVIKALPELQGLDILNQESTRQVLNSFLTQISFALVSSIVGIFLSVTMTVINALFSLDDLYITLNNKLASSLEFIWNEFQVQKDLQIESNNNYFDVPTDRIFENRKDNQTVQPISDEAVDHLWANEEYIDNPRRTGDSISANVQSLRKSISKEEPITSEKNKFTQREKQEHETEELFSFGDEISFLSEKIHQLESEMKVLNQKKKDHMISMEEWAQEITRLKNEEKRLIGLLQKTGS